jgi:hypothetical protein
MALPNLTVKFSNANKASAVGDNDNYLYVDTTNAGNFNLTPNNLLPNVNADFKPVKRPPPMGSDDGFDPGGSVIYIRAFPTIMNASAAAAMQFGDDWTAIYYTDAKGPYWAMSPKTEKSIPAGQILAIPVSNVSIGDGTGPSITADVTFFDISGVTTPNRTHHEYYFAIALHEAPGTPQLPQLQSAIACGISGGMERDYGGYKGVEMIRIRQRFEQNVSNSFFLSLSDVPGYPGGPAVAGAGTFFSISFPVAAGPFGALASSADLKGIRITAPSGWIVSSFLQATQPFWRIQVPQGEYIGYGDSGRNQIFFENVVTHLEIGFTELMLKYEGVPGFEDGAYTFPIYKWGWPELISASVVLYYNPANDAFLCRTFSWNVGSTFRVLMATDSDLAALPLRIPVDYYQPIGTFSDEIECDTWEDVYIDACVFGMETDTGSSMPLHPDPPIQITKAYSKPLGSS